MEIYSKSESKNKISKLVQKFESGIIEYKSNYSEADTESYLIELFFKYLNWDVSNEELEPGREVFKKQMTLKTKDETNKKPDYHVRIPDKNTNQMKSCFFIEAKQAKYDLKTNARYIKQVYKYAYSTLNASENPNNRVRLAVLTDFEEFRMFDCLDPTPLEKKYEDRFEAYNKHIVKDWTYKDYINKFDEVWDFLEYNNVVNGSLDKWYLTEKQIAGNRITPDKKFLDDLKRWRKDIAKSMFKNDKSLSDFQLTKATLLFINRIIFVKMLSDRVIEPDHLTNILPNLSKSKKTEVKLYELCKDIFKRLDHVYNGSVFDFDKDSDDIEISNNVLINIFEELKPENSIYTLAAMPVEIIGSVYELFIAEQIIKKGAGIALVPKYDEKKASGVYYTPRYIVEYIVDNTLGKKLEECKTPDDVAKIKVLDPACGSGSFLIVAYQKLIDWYKKWYFDQLMKFTKKDNINQFTNKNKNKVRVIGEKKDYYTIHLSHKLKSEILTNNIFGVDLDPQAVMVTKFSLSMKALEDSTHDEVIEDYDLFKFPTLPNLDNNIKWGNSLIGSDFYVENKPSLFNEKEKTKIQVFDWDSKDGFQYIMKSGGFDVVIGNPPWVDLKGHPPELTRYYFKKYDSTENRINLYAIFLEKGLRVLNEKGKLGIIIPNSILYQSSYKNLRKFILDNKNIANIVRLPDNTFVGVKAESVIITIGNNDSLIDCIIYDRKSNISNISTKNCDDNKIINQDQWINNDFFVFDIFSDNQTIEIIKKIEKSKNELLNLCDFTLGITPYDKYKGHSEKQIIERVFHASTKKDKTFKTLLAGSDVKKYFVSWNGDEYISYGPWLGAPREKRFFTQPRILIRQIISGNPPSIYAGYSEEELYNTQTIFNLVLKQNLSPDINLKFILSIINSKLMNFYHLNKFLDQSKNLFQKILIQNAKKFPIPSIDFNNKSEKQKHDKLVQLVEQMLENQEYFYSSRTEDDKNCRRELTINN